MYEIPRYSIHRVTILLAKYKSLNYFILEKTIFLESVSELIACPIRLFLLVLNLAEESWLTVYLTLCIE